MNPFYHTDVRLRQGGVVSRRDVLRSAAAGLVGGALGFTDLMSLQADELRRQGKACILLWMQGAPSQLETFDPKPGTKTGGETKAISTSVSGVKIAENLPNVAKVMKDLAVIRSLTNQEGNHLRATYQLHTGYAPTATVKHPTLGSIVASEIGDPTCELPAFVRIGQTRAGGGGGFLGVEHDPFALASADRPPNHTTVLTREDRFLRRLDLSSRLEEDFAESGGKSQVEDHRKLYKKAARMVLSSEMKAFDLSQESESTRNAYGKTPFGSGCLLARRLVETGVTFVEVTLGSWDTHQDNFDRVRALTKQLDQPYAHLITDLKQRGMLDSTLVIWMGEFGRTPRINPRGGRDHFPRAFSGALAGGGVQGGQVIGATDASGNSIAARPVNVPSLFQSFCKSLAINPAKENLSPIGRPIALVNGGEPVAELF
ncbi:MAG: DUF1501 domain-containing protein, partial [Planctomycetales bacterium]